MRKFVCMIAALLAGYTTMEAQYFCTEQGAELHYVIYDEAGQSTANETVTVTNVQKKGNNESVVYFSKIVENKTKHNTSYTLYNWSYDGYNSVCTEDLMYGPYIASDADPAVYNEEIRLALQTDRKFKGDNSFMLQDALKGGEEMPQRSYAWQDGVVKNEVTITGTACLGYERISTTAGRFFDCLKISYLKRTKVLLKTKTVRVTEWYAKGVGLVQSESFDLKGKPAGKMILVKMTK